MFPQKKACILTALVLFSVLVSQVRASPNLTTLRADGVTIGITFPEEAHPLDTITHNVTIAAHTALTLQAFTLFIYAPVNSSLQEIKNRTLTWDFTENENLTTRIEFQLPKNTNGTLNCVMTFQTSQAASYSSYTFFTTRVSQLTFGEMQNLYNQMLANYIRQQTDYETLLNLYNGLLANYNSSLTNYTNLLSQHNDLQTKYNSQVTTYDSLLSVNNRLSQDYTTLNANYRTTLNELTASQSSYELLNSTRNSLQTSYNTLQNIYNALNQTHNDLLAECDNLLKELNNSEGEAGTNRILVFIFLLTIAALMALVFYLKRKKLDPYIVIRKETVTVDKDENK